MAAVHRTLLRLGLREQRIEACHLLQLVFFCCCLFMILAQADKMSGIRARWRAGHFRMQSASTHASSASKGLNHLIFHKVFFL